MIDGAKKDKKSKETEHNVTWEGQMMPTILRGSTEHNKQLREKRAKLALQNQQCREEVKPVDVPTVQPKQPVALKEIKDREALYNRAKQILNDYPVSLIKKQDNFKAPMVMSTPAKKSYLHCDETLDDLPLSPKKQVPILVLSPFSKAKARAEAVGVGLSEGCRGMYEIDELNSRIDLLARVTRR